jgi:RNA polymerase-interacting CarD/CdnL/TRCF family regulator
MYKVGDVVVYRRDVCRVTGFAKSSFNGEKCYVLVPYYEEGGRVEMTVPVANKGGHLRDLITPEQLQELIEKVPDVDTLENKPANMRSQYATVMKGDSLENLIMVIKTTYLRSAARQRNHKKSASIDEEYLNKAEKYLYNELAVVLGKSPKDCKAYFNAEVAKAARKEAKASKKAAKTKTAE